MFSLLLLLVFFYKGSGIIHCYFRVGMIGGEFPANVCRGS